MAFTEAQVKEHKKNILFEISENGLSLAKLTKKEGFPCKSIVYEWLQEDKTFMELYVRACDERAELIAEDIMNICDATAEDIILDPNGNPITNHNVIQRDRLRVDTRKWLLAKLHPKKYGDKMEHSGGLELKIDQITGMDIK